MSRLLEKAKAHAGGYFWLPCDICGEPFGGHEKPNGWLLRSPGRSTMTCPDCPGYWMEQDGRYVQLAPTLTESGPTLMVVTGSTDWKNPKSWPNVN